MNHRKNISLIRFLGGKSTAEEAGQVIRGLNSEQLTGEDWQDWVDLKTEELDTFTAARMSADITATETVLPKTKYNFWKVAAILIVMIGAGVLMFLQQRSATTGDVISNKVASTDRIRQNAGPRKISFRIGDSSLITLFPGASLRYNEDSLSTGSRRNLYLTGSGHFDVAKDSARPFTVYSKLLYATALGTSFDVIGEKGKCTVKLYTGKVVVGKTGTNPWNQPILLLPGEEVDLSGVKNRFITNHKSTAQLFFALTRHKSTRSGIRFDNTSLPDVFKTLEKNYHRSIVFESATTRHLYFTGEVLASDSLPVVMKIICSMNELHLRDSAGVFLVQP